MKTWFITGAARGLGNAVARAALAAGDNVVATGRDHSVIQTSLGHSERLLALSLDVTEPAQAVAAAASAKSHFGGIDVLVNNAGYGLIGALEEYSDMELIAQFKTNVFGLAYVTRAVLPLMRERRSGHIINISSAAGIAGFTGASAYSASKFAVEGMSEALAQEISPLGIKLTIVEAGYFRTEFLTAGSVVFAERVIGDYDDTAGMARREAQDMNGKQGGDPDKLAQALLRLTLEQSPPFRFNAGEDSVGLLEHTLASKAAELTRWRDLSLSLAHDD